MTSDSFVEIVDSARSRGATDIVVPVARRLSADVLTPVLALLRMRAGHSGTFLFESVEGGEKLARYSFLGHNPFLILQGHPEGTSVLKRGKGPVFDIDPEASVISNLKGIFNRFEEVHVETHSARREGGPPPLPGRDGAMWRCSIHRAEYSGR